MKTKRINGKAMKIELKQENLTDNIVDVDINVDLILDLIPQHIHEAHLKIQERIMDWRNHEVDKFRYKFNNEERNREEWW